MDYNYNIIMIDSFLKNDNTDYLKFLKERCLENYAQEIIEKISFIGKPIIIGNYKFDFLPGNYNYEDRLRLNSVIEVLEDNKIYLSKNLMNKDIDLNLLTRVYV